MEATERRCNRTSMSRMVDQALLQQAMKLSDAERAELADAIWHTIDPDALPVSPAELAFVEKRIAEADAHPEQSRPWEEARAELRALLE